MKVFYEYVLKPKKNKNLLVHKMLDTNVAILKFFPGLSLSVLKSVLNADGLKALIIETYGAGNAPTDLWLLAELKKAMNNGLHIINITQCSGGSVMMGQYETSEQLLKLQVINGKDITTEAAITKLMCLLGDNVSDESLKIVFETSLRGEMK